MRHFALQHSLPQAKRRLSRDFPANSQKVAHRILADPQTSSWSKMATHPVGFRLASAQPTFYGGSSDNILHFSLNRSLGITVSNQTVSRRYLRARSRT